MMKRSLLIDHWNSFKVSRSPLILKLCLVRDNFILEVAFYFEEAFEAFFGLLLKASFEKLVKGL